MRIGRWKKYYPPPPQKKSLDERFNDQLNPLVEFKQELDALFTEYQRLAALVVDDYDSEEDDFDINDFSETTKTRFFNWYKQYQATLGKAVDLKIIDQDFIDNYDQEGWNTDPFWSNVRLLMNSTTELDKLELAIAELENSLKARVKGYEEAASHPAMILLSIFTVAVPHIITGIIYLVDSAIANMRIALNDKERLSLLESKENSEAYLQTQPQPFRELKQNIYEQAHKLRHPFFAPLKEAAKTKTEEVEKIPPGSPTPSPSHSDNED